MYTRRSGVVTREVLILVYKALNEALDKKTPLDRGLADAQKFATAWAECVDKNPNKSPSCARHVDPNYKGFNSEDLPTGAGSG
jgi:hypothetical protein